MGLKAGKIGDLSASMARAMEDAFRNEWVRVKEGSAPVMTEDMQLIFVAVAQGVVDHLVANPDAFNVTVNSHSSGDTSHSHSTEVSIDGN